MTGFQYCIWGTHQEGAVMALQSHPFPDPTEAIVCPAHKKIKLVKYENFKAWM
jgi:hypothetical protein